MAERLLSSSSLTISEIARITELNEDIIEEIVNIAARKASPTDGNIARIFTVTIVVAAAIIPR